MNAADIRKNYARYIGGDVIAKKATDEEIEYLVQLGDNFAIRYNEAMQILASKNRLQKEIEER